MQLDFTPENLDRYFKKQLSEAEMKAVEQKIAQDPLLKSEIDFQQEVIEAICQQRKWEIKQRLDALAPESSPLFNIPRLAFGTTLTIAGLLTATLFWFDNKKIVNAPQTKNQEKPITKHIHDEKKVAKNVKQPTIIKQTENQPIAVPYTTQNIQNTPNLPAPKAEIKKIEEPCLPKVQEEEATLSAQDALIKLYDETFWFEVSNTDTDNGAFDRNSEIEHSLERVMASKMLRYQYYNGQLWLYNNTNSGKQLHTLIDGKERHFLYYENVYYEFFESQMTETLMKPIRDKKILSLVKEMITQATHQ